MELSYNQNYSHFAIYPADTLHVTDDKYLKFYPESRPGTKWKNVFQICFSGWISTYIYKCFAQDCWLQKNVIKKKQETQTLFRMVISVKKKTKSTKSTWKKAMVIWDFNIPFCVSLLLQRQLNFCNAINLYSHQFGYIILLFRPSLFDPVESIFIHTLIALIRLACNTDLYIR